MTNNFQATWSFKNAITIFLIVVASLFGLEILLFYTGLNDTLKAAFPKNIIIIGFFLIQSLIFILPIIILSFIKHKKLNWSSFGFTKKGIFKSIIPAIGGYFIYLGVTFIVMLIVLYGGIEIPGYQLSQPVLPIFGNSNLAFIVAGIVIILFAPLVEEIFFRGFLLQGLVSGTNKYLGAVATAVFFATIHLQFGSFLPILILGLILSGLFLRTKSIWPCIWFHIINNGVAFIIQLLIIKGSIPLDL